METQLSTQAQTAQLSAASLPSSHRIGDRSIDVVGGGFAGTLAVIILLREFEKTYRNNPGIRLHITWFDEHGNFGCGLPYAGQQDARDDFAYLLNQPANQMSPFADEPNHYADWLKSQGLPYGAVSFTPRAVYGRYLETILKNAQHRTLAAGAPVTIRQRRERVESFSSKHDALLLGFASGAEDTPDGLILALGHHAKDSFAHLGPNAAYVSRPFDLAQYRDAIGARIEATTCALIGGGPTSLDALRGFEQLGFRGNYLLISDAPGQLWPYYPWQYQPETKYVLRYLTADAVCNSPGRACVRRLLRRELRNAGESGFGPGHVYAAVPIELLAARAEAARNPAAVNEFARQIGQLRGSIAAPENWDLYQRLLGEKRLHLVAGRAAADKTFYDRGSHTFRIGVDQPDGVLLSLRSDLLVNCALFSKQRETGIGRQAIAAITGGDSASSLAEYNTYLVGPIDPSPAKALRTWGVESFRNDIAHAATELLANLGFSNLRN